MEYGVSTLQVKALKQSIISALTRLKLNAD